MKKIYCKGIVILALLSLQITFAQSARDKVESDIINIQKDIVAKLSGKDPIKGSKVLKSRFTSSERKVTADYLNKLLKGIGLSSKKNSYSVQNKKGKVFSGSNIYAEIPSTTPSDEYVILGAHYDTAKGSPGANHNATGVALTYYIASRLVKLQSRSRNFIVVFWDQQEQSMMGCRMFAEKLKKEKKNVHSMHRVDFMGWDEDGDRAIEVLTSSLKLESLYRGESYSPVFKRELATQESKIFSSLGFETITITEELKNADNSPHPHQVSDTYVTVNFKYLTETTQTVYNVMQELAL